MSRAKKNGATTGVFASVLIASALTFMGASPANGADGPASDPRALIPAQLLGAWKADLEASHFAAAAPKAEMRIFEYTRGGKLLVNLLIESAKGTQILADWTVQLDGTPGLEYFAPNGTTPYNVVTLKKLDERTFYLTASKHGAINETGTFRLSPDGKTLTFTSKATGHPQAVVVYHRWNLID